MGAGFDKPSNARYFALRLLKIHGDRSFKDTISFEELQKMAKRCGEVPEDSEREETHWLGRLGVSDLKHSSLNYYSTEATWVNRQVAQLQEKAHTGTKKRLMASETFPQGDSTIKRHRLE
jgi:DNA ligase 4